jgi:hypothetical protein
MKKGGLFCLMVLDSQSQEAASGGGLLADRVPRQTGSTCVNVSSALSFF